MMMLMSSLITILYITSVGRASHGSQERRKMIDSDTYSQPEFGPAPNLTRVQVDSTAFLHCNVLHLEEDNQASFPTQTGMRLINAKMLYWLRCIQWHSKHICSSLLHELPAGPAGPDDGGVPVESLHSLSNSLLQTSHITSKCY